MSDEGADEQEEEEVESGGHTVGARVAREARLSVCRLCVSAACGGVGMCLWLGRGGDVCGDAEV